MRGSLYARAGSRRVEDDLVVLDGDRDGVSSGAVRQRRARGAWLEQVELDRRLLQHHEHQKGPSQPPEQSEEPLKKHALRLLPPADSRLSWLPVKRQGPSSARVSWRWFVETGCSFVEVCSSARGW